MDKWRFELAQIKKEFENGTFKGKMDTASRENILKPGHSTQKEPTDTAGILTMAFVNMQPFDSVYSTAEAFEKGTLFPDIDKPFQGGFCK